MSVITVAGSKGGTGKTLAVQLLASHLAAEMRVLALDADPTEALSRWAARTHEGAAFEVIAQANENALADLIDKKRDSVDLVLIDTAGFGNLAASMAMTAADAVLVPSLAGEADVTEAEKTIQRVTALAKVARCEIPVRVLMNRVKKTTLAKHANKEMIAAGLPRLDASLSDLVAYGELTYSGRLPDKGPAHDEVAALIKELRALGWIPKKTTLRKAVAA